MEMTLSDIADSAQTLSAQLAAGIPAVEGAGLLSQVQPEYSEFWGEVAKKMANGTTLSQTLSAVWPSSLIAIVSAGESAGTTDTVLFQIEQAVRMQILMREQLGRLKRPVGTLCFGIAVFLFMMLYVIPNFNEGMRTSDSANTDSLTALSTTLSALIMPIWLPLLASVCVGIFLFYSWAKTPAGKIAMIDASLSVPLFGPAIRDFYYSVWARFLGTICAAGIPLIQGLSLTLESLPTRLRSGIEQFEFELRVKNTSVQQAADSKFWDLADQRHDWPLYLRRAFISGANTGKTDDELKGASGLIMRYAQRRFDVAIDRANAIAFISCGGLALVSAISLYLPILTSLKNIS